MVLNRHDYWTTTNTYIRIYVTRFVVRTSNINQTSNQYINSIKPPPSSYKCIISYSSLISPWFRLLLLFLLLLLLVLPQSPKLCWGHRQQQQPTTKKLQEPGGCVIVAWEGSTLDERQTRVRATTSWLIKGWPPLLGDMTWRASSDNHIFSVTFDKHDAQWRLYHVCYRISTINYRILTNDNDDDNNNDNDNNNVLITIKEHIVHMHANEV